MKGEPVAIFYAWVCEACFSLGEFWGTTIPNNLLGKPCIVCGAVGAHQVDSATIAHIFRLREGAIVND